MKTIAEVLADNVRAGRKKLRLNQEDLAECTGVSTTMIQKIERRESWVGRDTIAALARALQTTEIALFQFVPLEHDISECAKRVAAFVTGEPQPAAIPQDILAALRNHAEDPAILDAVRAVLLIKDAISEAGVEAREPAHPKTPKQPKTG